MCRSSSIENVYLKTQQLLYFDMQVSLYLQSYFTNQQMRRSTKPLKGQRWWKDMKGKLKHFKALAHPESILFLCKTFVPPQIFLFNQKTFLSSEIILHSLANLSWLWRDGYISPVFPKRICIIFSYSALVHINYFPILDQHCQEINRIWNAQSIVLTATIFFELLSRQGIAFFYLFCIC